MITAVALVCMLEQPDQCGVITSTSFYETQEACIGDIGNAVVWAQGNGQFIVDYYCHNWGSPA